MWSLPIITNLLSSLFLSLLDRQPPEVLVAAGGLVCGGGLGAGASGLGDGSELGGRYSVRAGGGGGFGGSGGVGAVRGFCVGGDAAFEIGAGAGSGGGGGLGGGGGFEGGAGDWFGAGGDKSDHRRVLALSRR